MAQADGIFKVTNNELLSEAPYAVVKAERAETFLTPRVKRGHLCCGGCGCNCCCDVRRASIVVDIIKICFNVLNLLAVTLLFAFTKAGYSQFYDAYQFTDDQAAQQFQSMDFLNDDHYHAGGSVSNAPSNFWFAFLISWNIISIICYGCGIAGAVKYNTALVTVAVVWYFADFVESVVFDDVIGAGIAAFFAYPHIVFIMEVQKGIMSRENYHNEMHCCCV